MRHLLRCRGRSYMRTRRGSNRTVAPIPTAGRGGDLTGQRSGLTCAVGVLPSAGARRYVGDSPKVQFSRNGSIHPGSWPAQPGRRLLMAVGLWG